MDVQSTLPRRQGGALIAAGISPPDGRNRGNVVIVPWAWPGHASCHGHQDSIQNQSRLVRRLASVCTGAYFLAEAGLLDGLSATTHWGYTEDFERRFPRVQLDPDKIFIKQGPIYTAAGVTSGIDLALALVEEDH